jgi:tetratricopeptide (TPR) repeat protein
MQKVLARIADSAQSFNAEDIEAASRELVDYINANIATHPAAFARALKTAADAFDGKQVAALCKQLVAHLHSRCEPYPLSESRDILRTLRDKRHNHLLVSVGDAFLQTGQDAPRIRKLYAQALLDLGQLSAALAVLADLEKLCLAQQDADELAETRGLMGRAYKQMYINAAASGSPGSLALEHLQQAIDSYGNVYRTDKKLAWQGVNQAALLERARRDGVELSANQADSAAIASEILRGIDDNAEAADLWQCATAAECCLALQDYTRCLDWIIHYTQDKQSLAAADAFEYASTLRQFEEVWQLDDTHTEQGQILSLLRSALLRQEGGCVEIKNPAKLLDQASALAGNASFEQVLGKDRYKTFQWYLTGLERASSVAQICDRMGNGQGTGFLVRGADIHPAISHEWVVVTNAHVISDDSREQSGTPAALPADGTRIRFEAKDPDTLYDVDEILFSSPRTELDCTIVSLRTPIQHDKPFPIAKRLPLLNKNQRVYAIGHPRGGGLSYSLNDNLLLDHECPRVHYRAPTEGGSSGSPIFNQQWDLVALHHAGGTEMKMLNGKAGTYPANEGLDFQSILAAVATALE